MGLQDIWLVVGQHTDAIQKEIIGNPWVKSRIHFLRLPSQLRSMFQSLTYAVSHVTGPLLVTPCDLIFEKYPLSPEEVESVTPETLLVIASPMTKDWHSAHQCLLKAEQMADGATIVKDIGIDIPHGNFHEMGIYLIGEKARTYFEVAPESAVDRAAGRKNMANRINGILFKRKKCQLLSQHVGSGV